MSDKRGVCVGLSALLILGCAGEAPNTPAVRASRSPDLASEPAPAKMRALEGADPLENVIEVRPGVYSGSAPMDEEGFRALRRLGVRSVISVDGARPEAELARAHGIETTHIPLRYSGIEPAQRAQLARAMRDAAWPVYVHCHHGKHRGPAAVAAALIGLGRMDRAEGERLMELAGTSRAYAGLWASVRTCEALGEAAIDAAGAGKAGEDTGANQGANHGVDMGEAMARMERSWYRLLDARERGWSADPGGRASAPVEYAGDITETMRALASDASFEGESEDFRARMLRAIEQAAALERAIEIGDAAEAEARFEALGASCRSCHRVYRD